MGNRINYSYETLKKFLHTRTELKTNINTVAEMVDLCKYLGKETVEFTLRQGSYDM